MSVRYRTQNAQYFQRTAGLSKHHFKFGPCGDAGPTPLKLVDCKVFPLCSNRTMNDRPASWRMPSPKQMEKLARKRARQTDPSSEPTPDQPSPPEWWETLPRFSSTSFEVQFLLL